MQLIIIIYGQILLQYLCRRRNNKHNHKTGSVKNDSEKFVIHQSNANISFSLYFSNQMQI